MTYHIFIKRLCRQFDATTEATLSARRSINLKRFISQYSYRLRIQSDATRRPIDVFWLVSVYKQSMVNRSTVFFS